MCKNYILNVKIQLDSVNNVNIFPFDYKSSEEASSIFADLRKIGKILGIKDVLIAGICRSNKLDLITKNVKHFKRIKDLEIIEY